MAPRLLTILTGHNLPKIRQSREPGPSIINEKDDRGFYARGRANGNLGTRSAAQRSARAGKVMHNNRAS
jgi:hypothetical protein